MIENDLVNGRKHWTSLDGNQAIWYESHITNRWKIGFSSDRGSGLAAISSAHDSGCPTQKGMKYRYYNGSSWRLAPKNSFSIICSV